MYSRQQKSKVNKSVALAKLFMKNKKSKGPKQLPWGIPHLHDNLQDVTLDSPPTLER